MPHASSSDNGAVDILRWDLPSDFRWLGVINAALQEIGQALDWEQDALNQISIASIEAVSNAIEHGNRFDGSLRVSIELGVGENRFRIAVTDGGPGFPVDRLDAEAPSPDDPAFLGARGRGIFIMREIMDSIRIRRDEAGRFVVELEKAVGGDTVDG
ncbi:MAG: ATP-binding protein [Candidatus Krumholzibacteriia bacterium]|nr:ATP-binding protein [bacterium]MCB9513154.1 ATP-binding protein [Candidatus Latescibacterota bacterium]MCB9514618.1 ATP-binding protein [Candidatus Latescibacterota bacterium]